MSDYPRYEKQEKQEKEEEKQVEKQEKQEKSWDEKWRRDPLGAIIWALILIWAGLVLFAGNVGFLDSLGLPRGFETWGIIALGAGVIVFIEVIVRLLVPEFRRPVGGSLIFAAILVGVGLQEVWGWEVVWPAILIAIGVGVLIRGLLPKR
jgi:hypothetical protein